MDTEHFFTTAKPINQFLSTIVDSYFYIDVPVADLSLERELMIPFPRITFGYFFNHPFLVTNQTLNQSVSVNMIISRISSDKIVVQPQTDRVKIIGAHVKPFCLAYLMKQPVNNLPWLINTQDIFGKTATDFQKKIDRCSNTQQMFNEEENIFLENILVRDLSLITRAVELIEKSSGNIRLSDLASELSISDRTLRNHFYDHIGCAPKEYIRLVKLRQVVHQMKHSENSLTDIAYANEYFDQAHFIHEVKNITGKSPAELRKKNPHFRFLQF